MCHFYQQNKCTRGSNCVFAHSSTELQEKPNLVKTKICMRWEKGLCQLASYECNYAHGMNNLRTSNKEFQDDSSAQEIHNLEKCDHKSTIIPTKASSFQQQESSLSPRPQMLSRKNNNFCPIITNNSLLSVNDSEKSHILLKPNSDESNVNVIKDHFDAYKSEKLPSKIDSKPKITSNPESTKLFSTISKSRMLEGSEDTNSTFLETIASSSNSLISTEVSEQFQCYVPIYPVVRSSNPMSSSPLYTSNIYIPIETCYVYIPPQYVLPIMQTTL